MERTIFNWTPSGFYFTPTDEDAVACYLKPKNDGLPHSCDIIREYDIYSCHPRLLPRDLQYGKPNELYFFVPADKAKKPRKVGPDRNVSKCYIWRVISDAKTIKLGETTAEKKNLVLSLNRGSKRIKTNWMMHEYSLVNPSSSTGHVSQRKEGFVFCRIYRKGKKIPLEGNAASPASTDLSMSDEDLPPSPVEIPSDRASAVQDSLDFPWRVEDLAALLDG